MGGTHSEWVWGGGGGALAGLDPQCGPRMSIKFDSNKHPDKAWRVTPSPILRPPPPLSPQRASTSSRYCVMSGSSNATSYLPTILTRQTRVFLHRRSLEPPPNFSILSTKVATLVGDVVGLTKWTTPSSKQHIGWSYYFIQWSLTIFLPTLSSEPCLNV